MAKEVRANARVQVTLEVDGGGPWGAECPMFQILHQATEHAKNEVIHLMKENSVRARMIGEPKVLVVMTEGTANGE